MSATGCDAVGRLDCLEVEVLTNNAPAIQLYESAGFVTEWMDHDRQALVMVRARQP